jgi:hypothetical protein
MLATLAPPGIRVRTNAVRLAATLDCSASLALFVKVAQSLMNIRKPSGARLNKNLVTSA